jgi:hypothetical protein
MTKPVLIIRLDSVTLTEGGQQLKFHSCIASGDPPLVLVGPIEVMVKDLGLKEEFCPGQKFSIDFTKI